MAKDKISSKQAEKKPYLKHWVKNVATVMRLKASELKHPGNQCFMVCRQCLLRFKGKRLPTIDEWEFAGGLCHSKEPALPNLATNPHHLGLVCRRRPQRPARHR